MFKTVFRVRSCIAVVILFISIHSPCLAESSKDVANLSALKESLIGLDAALGNIEASLNTLRNDLSNMVAQARYFPLERRLLDGDLFFEMKDYEKAATLYRDLIDNPDFRNNPGYWRTLNKLGEALFQLRNFYAARRYFEMAATPSAGSEYSTALARLLEIAINTRDFSSCEKYLALAESLKSSPIVAYSYGKYLYHRGRLTEAQQVFAQIPPGSPTYSRARYFIGVLDTIAGRLESALDNFMVAEKQPVVGDGDAEVATRASLARARILNELGRFEEAVSVLQSIDQQSPVYMESLFDLAWVYIKAGELEKALRALDMLLLNEPQGELAIMTNALRGRILSRLGDVESAGEVYRELTELLGPVTAELDKIASDSSVLTKYFDWVIRRDSRSFEMEVPISERTAAWLDTDPQMASIIQMFHDLARERENVRDSLEMVERLEWALVSGDKIEAFPGLKEKYLQFKEKEARFLDMAVEALSTVDGVLGSRLQGELGEHYAAAVRSRKEAVQAFARSPKTVEEYLLREKRSLEQYKELEKTLFQLESVLRIERQQVLAIEEWLREQHYRESGTPLPPEREATVRKDLEEIKKSLSAINEEMTRIKASVDRDTITNATLLDAMREEGAVRRSLIQAIKKEAEILSRVSSDLDPGLAEVVRSVVNVASRAATDATAIEPAINTVMELADKGASEYALAVQREKASLIADISEIQKAEMDARSFAQNEGAAVFRMVKDRLAEVLLEADLGLVDIAWQREQNIEDKIRALGQEKGERMRGIDEIEELVRPETVEPKTESSGGI